MLQVKDLVKVYKTKGGQEVRALDGVSLSFDDKGMVFLLGKSGSGKSTLLNVCGGLDTPDSGEIIVKGRSSKDFSAGDFDSYRNTFIGFIFQEYNILNEFNIEDNIALALELQGKSKDKAAIQNLLDQVELSAFAKRKPNTLSGGQKQRIAIARALIKNPEIIFADEPTGALDSETGKQVFDTLKKLSEDKLVIVVSHDREFAEEYGDRIIELKDGKVISDVIRTTQKIGDVQKVCFVDNNTIMIKKGSTLTSDYLDNINRFISKATDDVVITNFGSDIINKSKKSSLVKNNNISESFVPLKAQPEQKPYTAEESKFIRSRLPMRHAIKMGASGIKVKPVRFAFTIFLAVVAFVMFGLFSCLMLYDAETTNYQSLIDAKEEYMFLEKSFSANVVNINNNDKYEYQENISTKLTPTDIANIQKNYSIIPVYGNIMSNIENLTYSEIQKYYTTLIKGVVQTNENLQYIYGRAPQAQNEVAVSDFVYECLKAGKLVDKDGKTIVVSDSLENVVISLRGINMQVTGVFKAQQPAQKYKDLKTNNNEKDASAWSNIISNEYTPSFYNYIAVDEAGYNTLKTLITYRSMQLNYSNGLALDIIANDENISNYSMLRKLENNFGYYNNQLQQVSYNNEKNAVIVYPWTYAQILFNDMLQLQDVDLDSSDSLLYTELCNQLSVLSDEYRYDGNTEQYLTVFSKSKELLKKYNTSNLKITGNLNNSSIDINLLGLVFPVGMDFFPLHVSPDLYEAHKVASVNNGYYSESTSSYNPSDYQSARFMQAIINTANFDIKQYENLFKNTSASEEGAKYTLNNALYNQISTYTFMIALMSKVFLYAGIVMAVFAMLLLFNFISVSINYKKKEIGILRAVGARGSDVFKIFFSESIIIVAICSILAILFTGLTANAINNTITTQLGMQMSIFVFGWVSVLMIVGIAFVTALISTFLPVYKTARKKPVESIRSL